MFSKKTKKEIIIEGMMCEHCSKKVEDRLSKEEGISKVKVNLNKKCATIILDKEIDNDKLKSIIEELNYKVTNIVDK